jgi:hypothetical protein
MTKENYMALADVQEIWTDKQKPYIGQTFATKSELQTLEEKMEGPIYDAEHQCIVFPDAMDAYYDPDSGGIIF